MIAAGAVAPITGRPHFVDRAADHFGLMHAIDILETPIEQHDPPLAVGNADGDRNVVEDTLEDRLVVAQALLALLQLVDLGEDRDRAALGGWAVAEAEPMTVDIALEQRPGDRGAGASRVRDPIRLAADRSGHPAGGDVGAQDVRERAPRPQQIRVQAEQLAVAAVADDKGGLARREARKPSDEASMPSTSCVARRASVPPVSRAACDCSFREAMPGRRQDRCWPSQSEPRMRPDAAISRASTIARAATTNTCATSENRSHPASTCAKTMLAVVPKAAAQPRPIAGTDAQPAAGRSRRTSARHGSVVDARPARYCSRGDDCLLP